MSGKVLKIISSDLYGNVEDRTASIIACFCHLKYSNNYGIFVINDEGKKKLFCGSIHMKGNTLVVFSVKDDEKKYINEFIDEYVCDNLNEYKILDINELVKVDLISCSYIEYDNIDLLLNMAMPKSEKIVREKKNIEIKPIFLYILLGILLVFIIWISILYFQPRKVKELVCNNKLYDNKLDLYYEIEKTVKFNSDDIKESISVVKTYMFLDSSKYYEFKENELHNQYFNNGEGYKYIDNELQLRLLYEEDSVIDGYSPMLNFLVNEGYNCIEREYEE